MPNFKLLQVERPRTLSEIAADNIREAILRGEFRLGEVLKEGTLSTVMGISKTPIREAFATLKREGLLQGTSQKGARVFTLTPDELKQLCAYRFVLESAALEMALVCDAVVLASRLSSICKKMAAARKKGDFDSYLALDGQFHAAIFEISSNKFLQEAYRSVRDKVATLRNRLSRAPQRTDISYAEHVEIARLLEHGQIEEAKQVLFTQIDRGSEAYHEMTTKSGERVLGGEADADSP